MGDHVRTHYLRHKHAIGAIVGMEGPLKVVVALVDQVTKERAAKEVKLSGCLPKILITQTGHKIDFLQILYVNCSLSGYFKNTFRLGSKCFLRLVYKGVPWWTKNGHLLAQKCQLSITLATPHNT